MARIGAWVVDGNYARSRDVVMSRADTVLWLRVSRWLVMRQILRRTAGRGLLRRELWNGHGALLSTAPISQRWIVVDNRRQVHSFLQELPQLRAS